MSLGEDGQSGSFQTSLVSNLKVLSTALGVRDSTGSWSVLTCVVAGLCCLIYIVSIPLQYGALSAYLLVQKLQVWRAITYCLLHANVIHLVFNVLALLQLGGSLERRVGPIGLLKVMGALNAISVILYCVGCYALDFVLDMDTAFTKASTVGYSIVLFGMLTVESVRLTHSREQVVLYGVIKVPKIVMPWVVVALMYLLVPHSSLIGHVCGVLSGYIFKLVFFNTDDNDYIEQTWAMNEYVSV
jgi:membrane associated rhomboid family serine protease